MNKLIAALRRVVAEERMPYYHVSDHPEQPTIRDQSRYPHKDPRALYLHIKGQHVFIKEWSKKDYRWDARVKDESKFLNIRRFGHDYPKVLKALGLRNETFFDSLIPDEEEPEAYEELKDEAPSDYPQFFKKKPWRLYGFIRGYIDDQAKFTDFFRKLGYEGIIDHEGCCVYSGEPQIIVFDPDNIEWGPREDNTPGGEYSMTALRRVVANLPEDWPFKIAKKDVMAALRRVVHSGISPIVFHYTTPASAADILKDDRFKLATTLGTPSEEQHRKKPAYFYLSTTRHRLGGYHLGYSGGVLMVLDGKKLGENYSGDPIDYWGESFRKENPKKFEAEDRVWSREPYIEPASYYINEIHVLEPHLKVGLEERFARWLRKLMLEAKKKHIPVHVFDNVAAWRSGDVRKAVPLSKMGLKPGKPMKHWSRERKSDLGPWVELYYKDREDQLSDDGKHKLRYVGWYEKDGWRQLETTIHNNKAEPEKLKPLIKVLKKEGWSKARQFYDHIIEKWKKILNDQEPS